MIIVIYIYIYILLFLCVLSGLSMFKQQTWGLPKRSDAFFQSKMNKSHSTIAVSAKRIAIQSTNNLPTLTYISHTIHISGRCSGDIIGGWMMIFLGKKGKATPATMFFSTIFNLGIWIAPSGISYGKIDEHCPLVRWLSHKKKCDWQ